MLGFLLAGRWGGVIGLLIGHLYDRRAVLAVDPWASLRQNAQSFSGNPEQTTFTMGVIVLGAKMARSDGRITRAEIDAFKKVFRVTPAQENAVGLLFDQARLSAEGFEPFAVQLAATFRRKPEVLEEILSGLFIIAAADYAGLSPAEITFLKRVCFLFGFSGEDFARIAARSGVTLPDNEKPRNIKAEAYAILGVNEASPPQAIKAAYRGLIRKHHPDKLMAQGVAPEFVATATEKMKRINAAYADICKARGIK